MSKQGSINKMFPEVGKQVNINKKHNVSATMFSEVDKQENADRKLKVSVTMLQEVGKQGNREALIGNIMSPSLPRTLFRRRIVLNVYLHNVKNFYTTRLAGLAKLVYLYSMIANAK